MTNVAQSRWKTIRNALAALVLLLFVLAFTGFGELLTFLVHVHTCPNNFQNGVIF